MNESDEAQGLQLYLQGQIEVPLRKAPSLLPGYTDTTVRKVLTE